MDEAESVGFIHKEKVAKRNTEEQKPIANRPIGNSTIGRVSHVSSPILTEVEQTKQAKAQKQLAIDQSAQAKAESRSRSIKTLEIDDYLFGLVMEGLLDEDFIPYGAKACYTLGLQRVNAIVIQVKSAQCDVNKGQSRMKLLAWKLNGAMQLHYKRQFYEQTQSSEGSSNHPEL